MSLAAPLKPWVSTAQTVWIFDLDNTLYPRTARLFDQIDRLMTAFISSEVGVGAEEADCLRQSYWQQYGATLTGMMERHGTDPSRFLAACHRLDLSAIVPDQGLSDAIAALPGRRIVHTNGPRDHADRILKALDLTDLFPEIVAIEDMRYRGKPSAEAFGMMLDQTGINPAQAVMFEDTANNLVEPHRLGMATVLVECATRPTHRQAPYIHHRTRDLADFLRLNCA